MALRASALATVLLAGCAARATVDLPVPARSATLSASLVAVPEELHDLVSGSIRRVACSATSICPSATAPISCADGFCDPAPRTVVLPLGDLLDLGAALVDGREFLRDVHDVQLLELAYVVEPVSLTVPLPELRVHWGSEGASDLSSPGVTLLATIAPGAPSGRAELDPAGNLAFGEHVLSVSSRVRLFLEARFDLAPGGPFPAGAAVVTVRATLRASGPPVDG